MTLGISPLVSSCTDPLAIAICWFLALKSLRKAPAHCIWSSSLFMQAQHLAQPRFQHCFRRALASSVQPLFKILELHGVCHLWMPNGDGNGGQSFSDVAYPVVSGKDGEGLSDGFVEGLCRYVERVRRLIQIVDNDRPGSKRH